MNELQSVGIEPTILEKFIHTFGWRFSNQQRWPTFQWIAAELLKTDKPIGVFETGTARIRGNWDGDGQSTLMWDFLAQATRGFVMSVDLNPDSCRVCRKQVKIASVINADSILAARLFKRAHETSLLFLDSYDWSEEKKAYSSLHCIGELAAIYEKLPSGCLIAVDDCHDDERGKHVMVKRFFDYAGIQRSVSGYLSVWRKP